eukprot:152045_1
MSTNYMSFSENEQQPSRIQTIPSRFDLTAGDIKANELLNNIVKDCGPKSWYYFLEHILESKVNDLSTSDHSPLDHHSNRYSYSFETFNKFFEIFKSANQAHHSTYIHTKNTFYIQIWLLHARSHIIAYQTKYRHSKSSSIKRQRLQLISVVYKKLFTSGIGVLFSPFYIEWAKYYILRNKIDKAKNKIKLGMKCKANPTESLTEFYAKLNHNSSHSNDFECFSYSDLSTSSDSDLLPIHTDTESENENDDENINPTQCTIHTAPRRVSFAENKSRENDQDSTHFDDEEDDDEFLKNLSRKLSTIAENNALSPAKDKQRGLSVRTPFAAMPNTSNKSAANTFKLSNNNKPFTPNTLLRNIKNGKPFTFSSRSRTTSKPSEPSSSASPKMKTTSFEPDTKSKSPFVEDRRKNRRESEPISPSWNNPMQPKLSQPNTEHAMAIQRASQSQSPAKYPYKVIQLQQQSNNGKHLAQPRLKKRKTAQQGKGNVMQNGTKYRVHNSKPRHQMNMMTVNDRKMMQLKCIGKGGSAKVYKVITKDTFEILALKKITVPNSVDVDGKDPMESFLNEIDLLRKLKNKSHCIQMIDYEIIDDVRSNSKEIRMLFECGEIDLAHLLKEQQNGYFDEVFAIAFYWHQMLVAVDTVHCFRIVHGDLKPANFLLVRGQLKLIDFGIAKQIVSNETMRIARDSQIGTLNYICPEALISSNNSTNCYKLGRSADVWSLGCILHQMSFGFTPFTHLKFAAKLQAIVNRSCKIDIKQHRSQHINGIVQQCLIREPNKRISIQQLLQHPIGRY